MGIGRRIRVGTIARMFGTGMRSMAVVDVVVAAWDWFGASRKQVPEWRDIPKLPRLRRNE